MSDPYGSFIPPKWVVVSTAPQTLALQIVAKPLQLVAWLLLTVYKNLPVAYPTSPSRTPTDTYSVEIGI